jgi:hypothetical protein
MVLFLTRNIELGVNMNQSNDQRPRQIIQRVSEVGGPIMPMVLFDQPLNNDEIRHNGIVDLHLSMDRQLNREIDLKEQNRALHEWESELGI